MYVYIQCTCTCVCYSPVCTCTCTHCIYDLIDACETPFLLYVDYVWMEKSMRGINKEA